MVVSCIGVVVYELVVIPHHTSVAREVHIVTARTENRPRHDRGAALMTAVGLTLKQLVLVRFAGWQ